MRCFRRKNSYSSRSPSRLVLVVTLCIILFIYHQLTAIVNIDLVNQLKPTISVIMPKSRQQIIPLHQIRKDNQNESPSPPTPATCNEGTLIRPREENIKYSGDYQEMLTADVGTVFLWRAYLDARTALNAPHVRILAMLYPNSTRLYPNSTSRARLPTLNLLCHLWYDSHRHPQVVQASVLWLWFSAFTSMHYRLLYQPFIYSCPLPAHSHTNPDLPRSVSLSAHYCHNTQNILNVTYNRPMESKYQSHKGKFAICLKGLNLLKSDVSLHLIEWLEMHFILGIDRVFIYRYNAHSNVDKVLDYYTNANKKIELIPRTLPGDLPNSDARQQYDFIKNPENLQQKRFNEVLTYQDCLYRNLYRFDYLLLVDLDEVIVPVHHTNYPDLIAYHRSTVKSANTSASYPVRNCYLMDDFQQMNGTYDQRYPSYLRFLQHTRRSKECNPLFNAVKSFYRTDLVLTAHNHLPLRELPGAQQSSPFDKMIARMHHYKSTHCPHNEDAKNSTTSVPCNKKYQETMSDTRMHAFDTLLVNRTSQVIGEVFPDLADI